MIPRWTRADEINLRRRVRLASGVDPRETRTVVPPEPTGKSLWCQPCKGGDHSHARAVVGPYVICRCVHCDALTIEVP